jgi:hypothetical protein
MIEIRVTHPKYPDDAPTEAVKCLERSRIHARRVDEDKILILDPKQFDAAYAALNESGFVPSLGGHASY